MIPPRLLVRLAARSLLLHKLRSTLSILGVVFGVAAVVAMSSVGEGARREAIQQIGALGVDTLTIRGRLQAPSEITAAAGPGLGLADAESIAAVVPHALAVAPVREATLPAETTSRHLDAPTVGTTPAYERAARLAVRVGRFLTPLDVRDRKRTAVLGAELARTLFPLSDAVGETVRLGGDWYDVVGVLEARGSRRAKGGGVRTRDINQAAFVPLPSLDRGPDRRPDGIEEIVVRMEEGTAVTAAAEVVRKVLARGSGAEVEIFVPREILRQTQRTQRIFNVVTGAVAGIGLIVGGIGIMNIMLASVAERTREVGVRRAVGATREEVAAHFLAEATLLTTSGGVIGIVLGLAGSAAIQQFAGWTTAVSPLMLVLALVTALLVGIGFGFYPAWRAAQLQPMEALRQQ
jgi:putative ABC transport system permease protein